MEQGGIIGLPIMENGSISSLNISFNDKLTYKKDRTLFEFDDEGLYDE